MIIFAGRKCVRMVEEAERTLWRPLGSPEATSRWPLMAGVQKRALKSELKRNRKSVAAAKPRLRRNGCLRLPAEMASSTPSRPTAGEVFCGSRFQSEGRHGHSAKEIAPQRRPPSFTALCSAISSDSLYDIWQSMHISFQTMRS